MAEQLYVYETTSQEYHARHYLAKLPLQSVLANSEEEADAALCRHYLHHRNPAWHSYQLTAISTWDAALGVWRQHKVRRARVLHEAQL